jgi:hypothetical protein
MKKGKQPEKKIELPLDWWPRLIQHCNKKWHLDGNEPKVRTEIYKRTSISERTFSYAKEDNKMTVRTFNKLALSLGCHYDDLQCILQSTGLISLSVAIPTELSLITKKINPQWADFNDYIAPENRPWTLRCKIYTESEYFRFGFKLLSKNVPVFGDGSIQSHDESILVHIGRNYWDRPALCMKKEDIFITSYQGIRRLEEKDRYIFSSSKCFTAELEFIVDSNYKAELRINNQPYFDLVAPPRICQRVAILAWGDQDEFRVDVANLSLTNN